VKVAVFDYGFGNVRSVVRALTHVGADTTLTSDVGQAREADGLVVPGVGAFAACMTALRVAGGADVVTERVAAGRPVLGICVGLQVLFTRGVEHGLDTPGLGLLPGVVEALDAPVVPHMGWTLVDAAPGSRLLTGVEGERFYFVHSYGVAASTAPSDDTRLTWAEHGNTRFVAAAERGALAGTQFHPEKSGDAGLTLLANWIGTL
jgi:glutamine amidotransferase